MSPCTPSCMLDRGVGVVRHHRRRAGLPHQPGLTADYSRRRDRPCTRCEIRSAEPSSCSPSGKRRCAGRHAAPTASWPSACVVSPGCSSTCTDAGDRVALWALNSDRYLELFVGIPCADRVIVPHNTRWAEPELRRRHARRRRQRADLRPRSGRPGRRRRAGHPPRHRRVRRAAGRSGGARARRHARQTLAGLFYTGGTTGSSKGVMLTHANLMANAVHTQLGQPLVADDRYLTMAPMFHAAGVYAALVLPWVGRHQRHRPGVRSRRRARPHRRRARSRAPSPCRRCWRRSSSARPPIHVTCPACAGCPTGRRPSPSRCSAVPPRCSAAS